MFVERLRSAYRKGGLGQVFRTMSSYARWRLNGAPPAIAPAVPTLDDWLQAYGQLLPTDADEGVGFSIICPVYNTPRALLRACIDSVVRQTHRNWELLLIDDASTSLDTRSVLEAAALSDARIKVERLNVNQGIAGATNRGAALAKEEYLVFLDHDDLLAPTALSWLSTVCESDLIYTDEDKVDEDGSHHSAFFKPSWSPRLLLCVNYVNHITCVRRSRFDQVGGLRAGFDGVQDHDLLLRLSEVSDLRVAHLPNVLYHWRAWSESTAARPADKLHAEERGIRAVQEAIDRRGWNAKAELGNGAPFSYRPHFNQLEERPLVKVVIPTRDRLDLLRKSVHGVLNRTDGLDLHLVIVDNGSSNPSTLDYLSKLSENHSNVDIVRVDDAFNYSRLCNLGANAGPDTPLLLFLNNDIEVVHRKWLQQLAGWLISDPEVVGVGPKLLFPDWTIQHAGVIIGLGGVAGHYAEYRPDEPKQGSLHDQAREVACLTAACLLVRTSDFLKVGGFLEILSMDFQDVDFCLRLRTETGGYMVYDPTYPLFHTQSASRGALGAANGYTLARMHFLWGEELSRGDPYYNPHLTLWDYDLRLSPIPHDLTGRLERLAARRA